MPLTIEAISQNVGLTEGIRATDPNDPCGQTSLSGLWLEIIHREPL